MKKKSELTEPELYFIIHSSDSLEDIAEKVGCSKRTVSLIREKNPVTNTAIVQEEDKSSQFMKSVKSPVRDGKDSVYIMTEGASNIVDDTTKKKKGIDTSGFITKVFNT